MKIFSSAIHLVWLIVLVVLSLASPIAASEFSSAPVLFAYDGQNPVRMAYDGRFLTVVDYDSAAVLSTTEEAHPTLGASSVFGKLSKFLAADTVAARQAIAHDFYQQAGWSEERIANHLQGIDFSQPVEVTTIPAGTQVVQYQIPGAPVGNYFAPVGTPANSLGIYTSGRVGSIFTATEDTTVLRSTAASVNNTWEVPGWTIEAPGRGTQLFTPNSSAFH